jgi:hypothetical protein
MANAETTAGQLRRLVLEISVTFHPFPRDDTYNLVILLSPRTAAHGAPLVSQDTAQRWDCRAFAYVKSGGNVDGSVTRGFDGG